MNIFRWLAIPVLAGVFSVKAEESFDVFVDRVSADWVRQIPQRATLNQYFSGGEQDALDRKLDATDGAYGLPLEAESRRPFYDRARTLLDQLGRYDRASLTLSQQASAATLAWHLQNLLQAEPMVSRYYVFDQFRGLQVSLVNFLSQTHPLRNKRDVENYLVRLSQVAKLLDEGTAEARSRADQGIVPPKFILERTLAQLARFLQPAPAKNVLVTSLEERSAGLKGMSAEEQRNAVEAAVKIVSEEIVPAFLRVQSLLQSQLSGAPLEGGLWSLPGGAEAYAAALHTNTTTDLTAGEIHELGLGEVARIEKEMDGLLRALGESEGSVQARFDRLQKAAQPSADPDPRPALLKRSEEIIREVWARTDTLFDLRPAAAVVVKREPAYTEATAAAHYSPPAPDGSRPGTFWFPLPGPQFRVFELRTLTYHEAVPGHHFQRALQLELKELPDFRKKRAFGSSVAFIEGWALYAERLAIEAGWYEGDATGRLGQLYNELFRARRLVVDTGLHAKRWTRQQAIDYGIPANEVERYIAMPGQACGYKIGELELLRLRAQMQAARGEKFSLKEFHNFVLRTSEVPLGALAESLDAYLRAAPQS